MSLFYEVTPELMTGNTLIDSEHKQLFQAVNQLMDACSKGKGREQVMQTAQFLRQYVDKHFQNEEQLQMKHNYPGHPAHKQFHNGYKQKLNETMQNLINEGPTLKTLGDLNQVVGVLVSHIRVEDKKLAQYIRDVR